MAKRVCGVYWVCVTASSCYVCVCVSISNQPAGCQTLSGRVCQSIPRCVFFHTHPSFTSTTEKRETCLHLSAWLSKAIDNYNMEWAIALCVNWGMDIAHWGGYEFRSSWIIQPTPPPPHRSSLTHKGTSFIALFEFVIKQQVYLDPVWSILKNHMVDKHQASLDVYINKYFAYYATNWQEIQTISIH